MEIANRMSSLPVGHYEVGVHMLTLEMITIARNEGAPAFHEDRVIKGHSQKLNMKCSHALLTVGSKL